MCCLVSWCFVFCRLSVICCVVLFSPLLIIELSSCLLICLFVPSCCISFVLSCFVSVFVRLVLSSFVCFLLVLSCSFLLCLVLSRLVSLRLCLSWLASCFRNVTLFRCFSRCLLFFLMSSRAFTPYCDLLNFLFFLMILSRSFSFCFGLSS